MYNSVSYGFYFIEINSANVMWSCKPDLYKKSDFYIQKIQNSVLTMSGQGLPSFSVLQWRHAYLRFKTTAKIYGGNKSQLIGDFIDPHIRIFT